MTLGAKMTSSSLPPSWHVGLEIRCFKPMPTVATTMSAVLAVFAVSSKFFVLRLSLPLDRASLSASSINPIMKGVPEVTANGVMSAEVNCSPTAVRKLIVALKIGMSFCSNVGKNSGLTSRARDTSRRISSRVLLNSNAQLSGWKDVFAYVIALQRPAIACSSSHH